MESVEAALFGNGVFADIITWPYWIKEDPKFNGVLMGKERSRPWEEGHVRMEAATAAQLPQPGTTKDCQQGRLETRKGRKEASPKSSEGAWPCDPLILDFYSPEW